MKTSGYQTFANPNYPEKTNKESHRSLKNQRQKHDTNYENKYLTFKRNDTLNEN